MAKNSSNNMEGPSQIPEMCCVLQPRLQWDLCWKKGWVWPLDVEPELVYCCWSSPWALWFKKKKKKKVVPPTCFYSACLCAEAQCLTHQLLAVFWLLLHTFPRYWSHLPVVCARVAALVGSWGLPPGLVMCPHFQGLDESGGLLFLTNHCCPSWIAYGFTSDVSKLVLQDLAPL